jgi:tetratricopeptide (TPR) repeat protein
VYQACEDFMSDQEQKKNDETVSPSPQAPRMAETEGHHELQHLMDFAQKHGTTLSVAIVVAAGIMLSVSLYRRHLETVRAEAESLLFKVESVQDLDNLVSRSGTTPIAPLALLKLAKAYYDAGSYELAVKKYEEFKAKYPEHPLTLAGDMGKLHCAEAMGQTEQALTGYTAFAAAHPKSFLAAEAFFGKGRCLETLGRLPEAKTVYEDLIASDPQGPWVMRAEEQLANVKRKLGEPVEKKTAATPAAASTNATPPVAERP